MKILIAEDDVVARTLLTRTLNQHHYEVVAVTDGRQAWEKLKQEYFPVLISDWMMPEMDGLELCRAVRRAPGDAYTYILMLTALSGRTNYLEAMKAGADDFLNKPVDEEQLLARLHVAERILGLRQHVKYLEGLLPICSYCKKIRDEHNAWEQIEKYIAPRSGAKFSHTICPECYEKVVKPQLKGI